MSLSKEPSNQRLFASVIIPVLNDAARLRLCLEALEHQTYPADQYEVVVVDNGSDQPLDDLVRSFTHARLLVEPQRSSYAARNTGIRAARGHYLVFTDSDCIPYPDWLEQGMTHLLAHPQCGLVTGPVTVFPQDDQRPTSAELFEMLYAFQVKIYVEKQHYGPTCNVFTTQAIMDAVGLFDGRLQSNGDKEWGQRVYARHYEQFYAESVRIQHPARRTFRQLLQKNLRTMQGRAQRMRLNTMDQSHTHPLIAQGIIPERDSHFLPKLREADLSIIQKARVLVVLIMLYVVTISVRFYYLITTRKKRVKISES